MQPLSSISKIGIWTAFAFCAVLSVMKQFLPGGTGDPAFYSFLPRCFFFVGMVQLSLWKRIDSLELALGAGSSDTDETNGT